MENYGKMRKSRETESESEKMMMKNEEVGENFKLINQNDVLKFHLS